MTRTSLAALVVVGIFAGCGGPAADENLALGTSQSAISTCGNNTTEPGEECDGTDQECNYMNNEYCGADCLCHNSCGNGVCDHYENSWTCPSDCADPNACGPYICDPDTEICCDDRIAPSCQPIGTMCRT